jgi:hypothetical protein
LSSLPGCYGAEPKLPLVPGHEVVGRIVQTGQDAGLIPVPDALFKGILRLSMVKERGEDDNCWLFGLKVLTTPRRWKDQSVHVCGDRLEIRVVFQKTIDLVFELRRRRPSGWNVVKHDVENFYFHGSESFAVF